MAVVKQFSDDVILGKWARIAMDDATPCYVAIGPRSIVIKKSNAGLIGPRLYEVRNINIIERIIENIMDIFPNDLTPVDMTNPILKPVVNAVLHCNELDRVVGLFKSMETTPYRGKSKMQLAIG